MTLTSKVNVQVSMMFIAKKISWSNWFQFTRFNSSLASILAALARWKSKRCPWPWHQIQGQHHVRSEMLPLIRPFLIMDMQFIEYAKYWLYLAADLDLDLWGQIQGRHLVRSVKLPRVAPLLSCTRQIINITQFWFVRWPWPLGSNSRSLIRCNPWVVKNPHAENRLKILKIGEVVRARTDRRTDRQTHKSKMSLPYYPNRTLLLV